MLHQDHFINFWTEFNKHKKAMIYIGLYASVVISTRAPISLGEKQDKC